MDPTKILVSKNWTIQNITKRKINKDGSLGKVIKDVTKIWLSDGKKGTLQGPFIEDYDFTFLRVFDGTPPKNKWKCIGRDSLGRWLWLIITKGNWKLFSGDSEEELELLIPKKVFKEKLWKDIPGYEDYQAHPDGEIRSKKKNRIIGSLGQDGYRAVTIDGKTERAHRMIALTFIPNPDELPQINHINGKKSDNRVVNLEWVTAAQNSQHAIDTGLKKNFGSQDTSVKITMRNGEEKIYDSLKKASEDLGVYEDTVGKSLAIRGGFYYGSKTYGERDWIWKAERMCVEESDPEERDIKVKGFTHLVARSDGVIFDKKYRRPMGSMFGKVMRIQGVIDGKSVAKYAHQLIALTFIPNPKKKPFVTHIDNDMLNNSIENLKWSTRKESSEHMYKTNPNIQTSLKSSSKKKSKALYQLELDGTIVKTYSSARKILEEFGAKPTIICRDYSEGISQHALGGFGYCYISDYSGPIVNEAFTRLFPELKDRTDINFDAIRPFVIRETRPVWQIDLGGKRIKLWDTIADVTKVKSKRSNLRKAVKSNLNIIAMQYFWAEATYEEIIDPDGPYEIEIPPWMKKSLRIPEGIKGITLKDSIIELLRLNVDVGSDLLRIRNRPLHQKSLDGEIIKTWSSPTKATLETGIPNARIANALVRPTKISNGFMWEYLKLQELCDGVPKKYRE